MLNPCRRSFYFEETIEIKTNTHTNICTYYKCFLANRYIKAEEGEFK